MNKSLFVVFCNDRVYTYGTEEECYKRVNLAGGLNIGEIFTIYQLSETPVAVLKVDLIKE